MTRDLDLLLVEEITAFKPIDRHIALKLMLHERMTPQVLGKLTMNDIAAIEPYIAPYSLVEVLGWLRIPGFFEWLLTPESFTIVMHKAKESAAQAVVDLLEIDNYDDAINPKILQIKLKAAELLLKDMKREQRIQNTLRINTNLPKHLASKSVEVLEEEVRKLKE